MSNTYVSLCDNVILNSIYYLKDFAHVSSLTNLCIYIYIYIYIHIPTASRTHFFFGCRSLALSAFIMPSLILCQMIDPRLGLHDTVGFAVPVRLEISKPMRRHSSHMHAIALMWGGGLVAPLAFWALDASSRWRQPAEPCPRAWRCRLRRMPPCLCEVHLSCGFPNVLCQQECHRAIRASPSGSSTAAPTSECVAEGWKAYIIYLSCLGCLGYVCICFADCWHWLILCLPRCLDISDSPLRCLVKVWLRAEWERRKMSVCQWLCYALRCGAHCPWQDSTLDKHPV